jgi:hypothetical protein
LDALRLAWLTPTLYDWLNHCQNSWLAICMNERTQ